MIEKAGAVLDPAKIDLICQERKIQREQNVHDAINSKLAEIARSCNPPSEEVTRPYGLEREGAANDVWHHILERITDPPKIKTLWNVSGMFRDILRGKYIETMLPEMVKLIQEKRPKYLLPIQPEFNEGLDKWKWESNVEISTFLNVRLLSKQCQMSSENICRSWKYFQGKLELNTTEIVQSCCETLDENPSVAVSFFPRSLLISEDDVEDDLEEFHEAITNFLELIGHRILHFTYNSSLNTSEEIYDCLREWASLMPNLEHLSFALHSRDQDDEEDEPELEEIEPFPNLPKLRSIDEGTACCGVLHSPFVQRILEACPGIQDLQLNEGDYVREHSVPALAGLVNLTCLQICPYRSLLMHQNLPWKLKKLILSREDMTNYRDTGPFRTTVSSSRLFPFLKQFEETLEHLELSMVDVCDGGDYLDLKNLRILYMELHESYSYANLDFLFYVEKLETLTVRIGDEFMRKLPLQEKVCTIIGESFLGRSVWEVFPYLKRFRLQASSYFEWDSGSMGEKYEEFRKAL